MTSTAAVGAARSAPINGHGTSTAGAGISAATASALRAENDLVGEVEFVVGKRQIASLSFVVVVALALASGVSYFAGKAAGKPEFGAAVAPAAETKPESAAVPEPPAVSTMEKTKVEETSPAPETTKAEPPPVQPTTAETAAKSNAGVKAVMAEAALPFDQSVFGEPVAGSLYIQVGAMDRFPAMILTSGLRKRGFPSITARGPSETIFRVLVGPYQTLPEYQNAKEAIRQMGITGFGRNGG